RSSAVSEADWLACADPDALFAFLKGRASDRQLQLFACACCRSIWPHITHEASRAAVEVAERFADRQVRDRERTAARRAPGVWAEASLACARKGQFPSAARRSAWYARITAGNACWRAAEPEHGTEAHHRGIAAEGAIQCALLRDIVGSPFRPASVDPARL